MLLELKIRTFSTVLNCSGLAVFVFILRNQTCTANTSKKSQYMLNECLMLNAYFFNLYFIVIFLYSFYYYIYLYIIFISFCVLSCVAVGFVGAFKEYNMKTRLFAPNLSSTSYLTTNHETCRKVRNITRPYAIPTCLVDSSYSFYILDLIVFIIDGEGLKVIQNVGIYTQDWHHLTKSFYNALIITKLPRASSFCENGD